MITTLIQDVKRTAALKHETSKRIRIAPDTIAEHRLKTSPLDKCHEAVDRYFRYVNKHTISEQQRDLIHTATNAMAKTFYGDLFEANMPAILKRNGWVESKCAPIVRGLSGRRVGKSWAMKIMIAALMIAKPGALPFIFAPSLRQSQLLLDLVERDLLEYAPEVFARIHKKLGQIEIKFGPGRVSKCIAAPASGKVRHRRKGKLYSLWSLSGPRHKTKSETSCADLFITTLATSIAAPFACRRHRSALSLRSFAPRKGFHEGGLPI